MRSQAQAELGDFTTTPRVLLLAALAIPVGVLGAVASYVLLKLIYFFTDLSFFGRLSFANVSPALNHLGAWVVVVPIAGAIVVGLMARFGSEKIRGHGIPEAIETIWMNGSRIQPRLALLKPIASAICIGTGGPFGAEGPIIVTGGALGSLIAQFFKFSAAERKTLLVAGAAAGMSATFATPVAAVALAVELLLFEWKPRSFIPVAIASATAAACRHDWLGPGPIFPVPPHPAFIGPLGLLACGVCGLLAGILSSLLTRAVYFTEDTFKRVPIHWMWWPAIGAVFVGVGGWVFPDALGVGYDVIGRLLMGHDSTKLLIGVLLVKSTIWAIALGSGTSGGVLAPLLMMGAALGGVEARFLPYEGAGFWELTSMGAILGGTLGVPFTSILFALELTHDLNALLPLLVAVTTAQCFSVLVMKRSILTEKIVRKGYHVSREYAIDPLEVLFVKDVMATSIVVLPLLAAGSELARSVANEEAGRHQRLFPVIDEREAFVGVIGLNRLQQALAEGGTRKGELHLEPLIHRDPIVAYPDEPLSRIADRMARHGVNRLPVLDPADPGRLLGLVSMTDCLQARARNVQEEERRERVLGAMYRWPQAGIVSRSPAQPGSDRNR